MLNTVGIVTKLRPLLLTLLLLTLLVVFISGEELVFKGVMYEPDGF